MELIPIRDGRLENHREVIKALIHGTAQANRIITMEQLLDNIYIHFDRELDEHGHQFRILLNREVQHCIKELVDDGVLITGINYMTYVEKES